MTSCLSGRNELVGILLRSAYQEEGISSDEYALWTSKLKFV